MSRSFIVVVLVLGWQVWAPSRSNAQDTPRPLVWDIARSVLIDPTTYAPAALSYGALRLDWKSSQVFFDNGWLEENPKYTISGRPNDVPLSYAAGNQWIRKAALAQLQQSITANLAIGISERVLIAKYPQHRKLLGVMSWAGRISAASYMTYLGTAQHIRQIGRNRRLARANGYSQ